MGVKKSADFFTDGEQARIAAAVASAEALTTGEIATMVVDASDSYREAKVLGGFFIAGLLSLVLAVALHHVTIWTYIPLVLILYFPVVFLMSQCPRLKLMFMHRQRITEAVRARAVRAFFEKGLYRTREETGVMIFISILERKVWILGDRGINARIAPESWSRFATEVASGMRDGQACEALCRVIAACGVELARHFPARPDDVNELPDAVLKD